MATIQGDLPILYILLAVVILLALLAAIGAWVRGGGLNRQDAENLFSDAQERHREELTRLETALEKSRRESAEALAKAHELMDARMKDLNEQVTRSRAELESVITTSTKEQRESLNGEIQSISRIITEAERRSGTGMDNINGTLQQLQTQVQLAGDSMTRTLEEMARQQRDQKAQSTIQLCEALITSLGTLKSTISNQLTQTESPHPVNAEEVSDQAALEAPAPPPAWQSPFEDDNEARSDEQEDPITIEGEDAGEEAEEENFAFVRPDEVIEGSDAEKSPANGSITDADTNHDVDEHNEEAADDSAYRQDRTGF